MILLSKVVLASIEEEPVKDGKQQEKHDIIQYNQPFYARDQGIKQYIQMKQ